MVKVGINRVVSQHDIVNEVAKKTGFFKTDILTILKALGDVVEEQALSVREDDNIEIKVFSGFKIEARYTPERLMKHNVATDEPFLTPPNVLLYPMFSLKFKEQLKYKYREVMGLPQSDYMKKRMEAKQN